jgi:hypothetical protein
VPPKQRRPRRRVLQDIDPLAFAAGWRIEAAAAAGPVEGLHVDVIRPSDLVALSCTFTGCDLEVGGTRPAAVVPRDGETALLVVEYGFQHSYEEAIYEEVPAGEAVQVPNSMIPSGDPTADTTIGASSDLSTPPRGFIPARGSRVVYDLQSEPVEFSTPGILAAMQRLPLVLHPLGAPGGEAPTGVEVDVEAPPLNFPIIQLGDGLAAELRGSGPRIFKPERSFLTESPAPDPATPVGALELAGNMARFRAEAARHTPVVARGTRVPADSPLHPDAGLTVREPRPPIFRVGRYSRRPQPTETAIEVPYRLVVSPTDNGRFTHAVDPVTSDLDSNVELWHSRLASVPTAGSDVPDENDHAHRVIRAVWARDREQVTDDSWKDPTQEQPPNPLSHPLSVAEAKPFLGSLDPLDRHMLVRQTSETWPGKQLLSALFPAPVGADALWLSALGAWLDFHGHWTTSGYSEAGIQSILSWDHVAPMGRDQYVGVTYPGYLYPFGLRATLVKVTERKMKEVHPSYAGLYQRMFLVVGVPTRTYGTREFPLTRVDIHPLTTPPLDYPGNFGKPFWPRLAGQDFNWVLDSLDQDGQPVRLRTPLMWVPESFTPYSEVDQDYRADARRVVAGAGQHIAYVAKVGDAPDSRLETTSLYLSGKARLGGSEPSMTAALVALPAIQRISPTPPLAVSYRQEYIDSGLGAADVGDVWARVLERGAGDPEPTGADDPTSVAAAMLFGASGAGSDKSGGFMTPNLPVRAISVGSGPIGDIDSALASKIDPEKFLKQANLPKLFGLIDIIDILVDGGVLPAVVTDTLGTIARLVKDVEDLENVITDAVAEADQLVTRANDKSQKLKDTAAAAVTQAQKTEAKLQALVDAAEALVTSSDPLPVLADNLFTSTKALIPEVRTLAPQLTPLVRDQLLRYADLIDTVTESAQQIEDLLRAAEQFAETQEISFHFDWRPQLQNWPDTDPIFTLDPSDSDHLVLSVDGRVSAQGKSNVEVAAELRDFSLTCFGAEPLIKVPFDHMSFKAGTAGKPDIDVVLGDIEFLGILSFVETIKELIPFDGFSDPPFMDVTAEGAKAGFTLALPSVGIGVFDLSNMSLGADVSIPFIGKSVTVGFNFCTRERPFTLAVMCLGGGGWFLIRVAPDGLDVLEVGLEATACLSVDLGVASGSISASIGIYMRLEGQKGSLTGYFRLRGEVDVLGLISASIELYMELVYHFDSGKMIGRATITVEVDVLCFSASVKVSAERQLAGANGDPSFREILGVQGKTSKYWTEYAAAFAAEEA